MVAKKRKKITGKRSQKVGALLLPIVSTIKFVRSETTFSRCSVLTGFKKEGSVSGKRKLGVVFLDGIQTHRDMDGGKNRQAKTEPKERNF